MTDTPSRVPWGPVLVRTHWFVDRVSLTITGREKFVIERWFRGDSLGDIAQALEVSPERVRQIADRALKKISFQPRAALKTCKSPADEIVRAIVDLDLLKLRLDAIHKKIKREGAP